jgi:hypothetical protein
MVNRGGSRILESGKSAHFLCLIDRILAPPWFSYAVIFSLQSRIIWDIWRYRDLTTGDTSSYFRGAYRWYQHFDVNIVWSPLYTAFYGAVLQATHGDVYHATIIHRVVIVLAATLGVLATLRRLLPPALALLIASWWAVLPINFETLYEVHLFALLPILAAWLVASVKDVPWARGAALAILLATAFLVRNEQIVAFGIFAAFCAGYEFHQCRQGLHGSRSRLGGYAVPALIAVLLIVFFYWRSDYQFPQIVAVAHGKHTLNMCQVYAFGYAQRHPQWNLSPWLECQSLMQSVFGRPLPTLGEMLRANPRATMAHFLWNVSLTGNGLQVALFNMMSGTVNPDYASVVRNVFGASILSAAVIAICVFGGIRLVRNWRYWWQVMLQKRAGTLALMLAEVCVSVLVILTQRPRPSYLFPTTVVIMTAIGLAAYALLGRKRLAFANMLAVLGVPVLVILTPSYYTLHKSDRLLLDAYRRLQPFTAILNNAQNRILLGDYSGELQNYLSLSLPKPVSFDYSILSSWHQHEPLIEFLHERRINVVFIQPRMMPELKARLGARQLLEDPQSAGWLRLAPPGGESDWLLLYRQPNP